MVEETEFNRLIRESQEPLTTIRGVIPQAEKKFPLISGKVRDTFDLGDSLLMVTTDRVSTFDVVHPNGVPNKGIILNQMSLKWYQIIGIPHHLISHHPEDFLNPFKGVEELRGRSMLVKKLKMVPIECVVRGYLTGSGWVSYQKTGAVCGIKLPRGMVESQKLDEPIFTPAIKETSGHDTNISFDQMSQLIDPILAYHLKKLSLHCYNIGAAYALSRGIIIADTKFEFGDLTLADEVLTPDSSRFWDANTYQSGRSQPSFDKQPVRDWATATGWDKEYPAPELPAEIVSQTTQRYIEAYRRLFG